MRIEPRPAPYGRRALCHQTDVRRAQPALAEAPDAAIICTPAHLHIPIAQAAAQAGVHLLIEKPLSTRLDGVEALVRQLESGKVTAGVAYVYRAHPVLTAMRDAVQSGRFGEPLQLVANGGQHFPFYRPAYREIYYKDRATGGGAVQDALTHVINASEWLIGPADRLVADIDHLALEGVTVEDTVHVLARHGQVMASYSLNQHQAANESTISVVCRGGIVRFEYHANRWRWAVEPGAEWHDESSPPLERDALFVRQAEAFLDAVEGSAPPLCTIQEGLQTLRVNLAILASAEQQTWQTIQRDKA